MPNHQHQPRCPDWPQYIDEDLRGCGSTNVIGPDKEGLYDCLDCGLWFQHTTNQHQHGNDEKAHS